MLKVVRLSHSEQKQEFLDQFDESHQTWLVSDLRSKFEIQNGLLRRSPGYHEWTVARASELWRLMLRRCRPELRVAPREFLESWLNSLLKKLSREGGGPLLRPQSARTLLELMDLFAPVFLDDEGPTRLHEFFAAHPEAAEKWRDWSEIALQLFRQILKDQWVLAGWIPALLAREPRLESCWDRDLIVDLGAGLRQSEATLIRRIAKMKDVIVLVPRLKDREAFPFLLKASEDLEGVADELVVRKPEEREVHSRCLRFSGPLAEVKQAVAQVRTWLEQGVAAGAIAIVATDIEEYWPMLEPYFEMEGIPVQKDRVVRLQAWPKVGGWLARLRLRLGRVDYADVEAGFNVDELEIRFEKFRALFRQSLEVEDFDIAPDLRHFFTKTSLPEEDLTLEEFMAWTAREWRDFDEGEGFEILLKEFLQTVPLTLRMDLESWVRYLENLASRKEMKLQSGEYDGVAIVNLSSVEGTRFERRLFLGLTESNFKKKGSALVAAADLSRLGWDFGYFLDHPEQNAMNFELSWALQTPAGEDLLCFPATGMTGSPEAPHPQWIQAGGGERLNLPPPTRWDDIMNSGLALNAKMERDRGPAETQILKARDFPRFSASLTEKYRNCSFQYAAERIFHLLDLPERDLDLDQRSKGNLAHKIFEKLTQEPFRADWSPDELRALIEGLRAEVDLEHREGVFWEVDRERHVKIAERFLKAEKQWRQDYPKARIIGRETRFEFWFDPESAEFFNQKGEGRIHLRGSIDRIETSPDDWLLVVDYKTFSDSKYNFANWIRDNHLQLAFYTWVIEGGFVSALAGKPVGGAQVYAYRRMERKGGWVLPEVTGVLAAQPAPKDASVEGKEAFLVEFETLLADTLRAAWRGEVKAWPRDGEIKICEQCRWSRVCRAPHLNT